MARRRCRPHRLAGQICCLARRNPRAVARRRHRRGLAGPSPGQARGPISISTNWPALSLRAASGGTDRGGRPRGSTGTPPRRRSLRNGRRSLPARVPPVDSVDDPLRQCRLKHSRPRRGSSFTCRQGSSSGCRLTPVARVEKCRLAATVRCRLMGKGQIKGEGRRSERRHFKELPILLVIPAKAGIQGREGLSGCPGPPAFAGATMTHYSSSSTV